MSTISAKGMFSTSIGKKLVMALTGFFLFTFLIVHLTGNLLLLRSDSGVAFNEYAHFMATNPMIRIMEIGLLLGFGFHIIYGLSLAMKNNSARGVGYKVNRPQANSTFYSRFMTWSGLTVLFFLLLHLWNFFFQHRVLTLGESETMYQTVNKLFQNPIYSFIYLIAMVLLAFHLNHGLQSLFQTLGLQVNKTYSNKFKTAGTVFAILLCAGYAAIPLYFMYALIF